MVGEVQLNDVAEIIMGQSPPGSTYNKSGVGLPFFQGVKDFNYRYPSIRVFCSEPSRIARPGDILFSVRAPIGRINIVEVECAIGRGLSIIRAREQSDRRYIEFVLRSMARQWEIIEGGGSVFGNATRRDLETLTLPWPDDVLEREAIGCILGTLDDKIELNRRMNQTLEAIAQALFKSWFIDFDPVHAKAEGRDTGLPPDIAALFPDSFEDSELGQIPQGWKVDTFGTTVRNIRQPVSPMLSPEKLIQHYSIPAFDKGGLPKLEYGRTIRSTKWRIPKESILVSKLNPEIERVWLPDVQEEEVAVCSTEFLCLVARQPFTRSYIYCLARSPIFRQQLESMVTGTSKSHQRAQTDAILDLRVIVPSLAVLGAFDCASARLLSCTLNSRKESGILTTVRDGLLPKLLSGELQVKDVQHSKEVLP